MPAITYITNIQITIMKNRILFSLMALFMLSLTFVSCGDKDDDDKGTDPKTAIVGKWKLTHIVEYEDGKEIGNKDVADGGVVEFKSNNTVVSTEVEDGKTYTYNGTWSINGNKLSFTLDEVGVSSVNTFSISGNTLTLIDEYTEDGHNYKDVVTYTKQ